MTLQFADRVYRTSIQGGVFRVDTQKVYMVGKWKKKYPYQEPCISPDQVRQMFRSSQKLFRVTLPIEAPIPKRRNLSTEVTNRP